VKLTSLLIAVWLFCTALANKLAGFIGSLVGDSEQQVENAFTIFSSIAIAGLETGLIVFLLSNKLINWMHGAQGKHCDDEEQKLEEEVAVVATHEGM
jgi:POT family proton-dependent oligopeptide transporter